MEIYFKSDGYTLKGVLSKAKDGRAPIVIGSHGLFSSGDSPKQIALAEALRRGGISFFRFDHKGCGVSEGVFRNVTSLESRVKDIINAVSALKKNGVHIGSLGLFGSSFGGSAVLSVSRRLKAKALVTLSAPIKSGPVGEALKRVRDSIIVGEDKDPFMPDEAFIKKNLRFNLETNIGDISHILVIHGEKDEIVPLSHAHEIFASVKTPKEMLVFPEGDHRVSNPLHQETFLKASSSWFFNHLKQAR